LNKPITFAAFVVSAVFVSHATNSQRKRDIGSAFPTTASTLFFCV